MTESKQPQNSLEIPSKMSAESRRFYSEVWFALRGQQRVLPAQGRDGGCAQALPNFRGSSSALLEAQFYFCLSIYLYFLGKNNRSRSGIFGLQEGHGESNHFCSVHCVFLTITSFRGHQDRIML